jgi:hypothetical protein
VKLSPQRLSALTRRILDAEGMHVFDCSRCGESKIGPKDRDVCLTCEPSLRTLPLMDRRGPKGFCVHGHAMTKENTYHRPDGFDECRVCQKDHKARYLARIRREREAFAARVRCRYGIRIESEHTAGRVGE